MKIQQRDNRNSVAGKSETNAHDYLIEAQDNYEQNSSSAVANQSLILGYSSATPHNHARHYLSEAHNNYKQNLSSAAANQLLTLGYSSVTPDNYQQNSSSAVINQSFILGYSSATPDNAANKPLVLTSFILGTCQVLMPYYCGILTYSMLLRGVVNELL